jgi:hypothetical protein
MATTYTLISSVTVGSGGAANIEFTSIPATYTDLVLLLSLRSNRSANQSAVALQFNNSTSGYTARYLRGSGSAANSYTESTFGSTAIYGTYMTANASLFISQEFYIPNYTSSNNKSVSGDGVEEDNGTTAYSMLTSGLWSNTSPITSITLLGEGSNFQQYSTFTLYGIRKY